MLGKKGELPRQYQPEKEVIKEGDYISLDGTTGEVLKGQINTIDPEISPSSYWVMISFIFFRSNLISIELSIVTILCWVKSVIDEFKLDIWIILVIPIIAHNPINSPKPLDILLLIFMIPPTLLVKICSFYNFIFFLKD